MIRTALVALLLASPAWAEPVTVGELTIERPQLRETPAGAPVAGGYLLVTNAGEADDRLLGVTTDRSPRTEVHEMRMDGEVMRMREVEGGLVIPAGQSVSLQPGGYHLMLMGPEPLTAGETHDVTLVFERAGDVVVPFAVETLETIREGLMGADEMDMGAPAGDG